MMRYDPIKIYLNHVFSYMCKNCWSWLSVALLQQPSWLLPFILQNTPRLTRPSEPNCCRVIFELLCTVLYQWLIIVPFGVSFTAIYIHKTYLDGCIHLITYISTDRGQRWRRRRRSHHRHRGCPRLTGCSTRSGHKQSAAWCGRGSTQRNSIIRWQRYWPANA